MSRKSKLILATLALLAGPAFADAPTGHAARQALLERFPDSLEFAREIAFCPDNTCILVRTQDAGVDLDGWMLAYLFHFGGYYALADWRADIGTPERIQGYPQSLRICLSEVDWTGCSKKTFDEAKVKVMFVRYDEGVRAEGEAGFVPHSGDPRKK